MNRNKKQARDSMDEKWFKGNRDRHGEEVAEGENTRTVEE
jgi:hypothetical protein